VKSVLGVAYFQNLKSYASNVYTWFNDHGEVQVTTDASDTVVRLKQEGFAYVPDGREEYPALTGRQALENYSKVGLHIDYALLEERMGAYIPLYQTQVRTGHQGETYVMDYYSYRRFDPFISLDFVFIDGELVQFETGRADEILMPMTDSAKARMIKKGMAYDEVRQILGVDGVRAYAEENKYLAGGLYEKYYWKLPGDEYVSYMEVQFFNGRVEYDSGIKIHGANGR
jgi:hypothetical protein